MGIYFYVIFLHELPFCPTVLISLKKIYGRGLTFTGALSATPAYTDDDTNQNNYGNKTCYNEGQNDIRRKWPELMPPH
jgi:hypothetical protein